MTDPAPARMPRMRRYLLAWFAGFIAFAIFAYTQLLEYYLEFGIALRTQSLLERTAQEFIDAEVKT